jgi:GTP cyclohydrolase I
MRQGFPRVVLRDRETFEGFLDGYTDGDGFRSKRWSGRLLVSSNVPFLSELSEVIGARFTPRTNGMASHLVVVDRWPSRGMFKPERHPLQLRESSWVQVREVRHRAAGSKPYTLYAFRLAPRSSFLVNGHLARQPW